MRLMLIAPPFACDLRQRRFAGDIDMPLSPDRSALAPPREWLGVLVAWAGAMSGDHIGSWLGSQAERMKEGYRSGAVLLVGALIVPAGVYLILKLARRRRHGPASLRPRAITRARDALTLPSETCPRDPIPTPRSQEARSRPEPAHGTDERFSRSV